MTKEYKIVSYDYTKHGKQIEEYLFNNKDDIFNTCITGVVETKSASYWNPHIVILDGNNVIGFLFGTLGTQKSEIKNILIFKKYRRKGLSLNLINHFINYAKINNSNLISLNCFKSNIEGLKYYKKNGFIETGYNKYNTFINSKWEEVIIFTKKI